MEDNSKNSTNSFSARIAAQEKRKLKALHENRSVWFGLGMFGMVGWSVAYRLCWELCWACGWTKRIR